MLTYGIIVLLIYVLFVVARVWSGYKPSKALNSLEFEHATIEKMPTWKFYVCQGIDWFLDLNVIGFMIYALTQI